MSTSAGPNIVEDGLVLSLDAANEKSFRGVPTTNLSRQDSNFTGTAYGFQNEFVTPALIKTYDSTIKTPIGYGATLVTESGARNYHTLSGWGGGGENFLHSISCYIKPMSSITSFWIGMLNSTGKGVNFNLDTLSVNSESVANNQYFIHAVDGYPGWIRIGANIEGRFGGWVGSLGYSMLSYTGTAGGKPYYITGIQYEYTSSPTHFITSQGTRGTTVATGGGWADLSSSSNHGTISGSPLYSYPNNGGILIDSADDYFYLASPSSLPAGSSDRTIISFVKTPSSLSGFQHVFHYGTAAQDKSFGLALYAGKLSTHPWVGGTPTSDATLQPSTIYGLAVAYRQSDSKHLFWINGIKDSSEPVRAINTGSTTARVGSRISTAIEGWIPNGQIYNVFIYNRVLSDSEIAQNFNALRGRYGI